MKQKKKCKLNENKENMEKQNKTVIFGLGNISSAGHTKV